MNRTIAIEISLPVENCMEDVPFGHSYAALEVTKTTIGIYGRAVPPNEDDEDLRYGLTWDDMRDAFVKCVLNRDDKGRKICGYPHEHFLNSILNMDSNGVPDIGYIDSEAAHIWFQVAVYGEVIYG